jgi:hypothetical protein
MFDERKTRDFCHIFLAVLMSVLFMSMPFTAAQGADSDQVDELMEGFGEENPPSEDPQLEDMMTGFDEDGIEAHSAARSSQSDAAISIDGYAKLGAAWNVSHDAPKPGETDWRGLSKLRTETQIDALAKLNPGWRLLMGGKLFYDAAYAIQGRDEFTDDVIDAYEWEAEWREIYLLGRLGRHLDLKIGRQIVVWGRSDNLRITDVLNPLDLREPGLTDIEDLRLPVTMTRLDGYYGPWNLSGLAIHEIRFDKNPAFGSDFYPSPTQLPQEEVPSDGGDNTEWGVALNGTFSGKDISLYWANLFDDTAHGAIGADGALIRKHARVTMWGCAGNLAAGNWLFKSEVAYRRGIKFFNTDNTSHQRLDGLIGTDYSGWDDTTITFEWAIRHLVDFDRHVKSPPDYAQEDEIINALRFTRTFMNETVELTLAALIYGPLGQDGALARMSVEYDWSDALSVIAGGVLYQSGDKYTLRHIGDNDRLFVEIKYSF